MPIAGRQDRRPFNTGLLIHTESHDEMRLGLFAIKYTSPDIGLPHRHDLSPPEARDDLHSISGPTGDSADVEHRWQASLIQDS